MTEVDIDVLILLIVSFILGWIGGKTYSKQE